jgi:hypothetical protein
MIDFLVFNDQAGDFIVTDEVQAVIENPKQEGSLIFLRGKEEILFSPLKPRELLRRLTIMKFKRENVDTSPVKTYPGRGPSFTQ